MDIVQSFDFITSLRELSDAFGEQSPDWSSLENLETLSYWSEEFNRERAVSIPFEVLQNIQNTFGKALRFRYLLGDIDVFDLSTSITPKALTDLQERTKRAATLTFSFEINKNELLKAKLPTLSPTVRAILIIYPSLFENLVSDSDLTSLEKSLWDEAPSKKTLIIIPEKTIFLDGSYFAVIGGMKLSHLNSIIPAEENNIEITNDLFERCENSVKWQSSYVRYLTPYHLNFEIKAGGEELITSALLAQRVNVILMYIADRTIIRNKKWTTVFNSTQQSVDICFFDPRTLKSTILSEGANHLFEIFQWAYDNHWSVSDRIPMVQFGVVQALNASEPTVRQNLLIENSKSIYENLQWHWKNFIDRKLFEYSNQVNALEELVSSSVKGFTDHINVLVKGLNDAMLAAVGAILGSVIAALFSDKFSDLIFRMGLWIYAAYLLIFPFLINMRNQRNHFNAFVNDFTYRRKRFEVRLYESKVKEIIGNQFEDSKIRFNSAFRNIIIIYIVIFITLIAISVFLPPIIHKSINAMQITDNPTLVVTPAIIGTFDINPTLQITTGTTGITPISITPSP